MAKKGKNPTPASVDPQQAALGQKRLESSSPGLFRIKVSFEKVDPATYEVKSSRVFTHPPMGNMKAALVILEAVVSAQDRAFMEVVIPD